MAFVIKQIQILESLNLSKNSLKNYFALKKRSFIYWKIIILKKKNNFPSIIAETNNLKKSYFCIKTVNLFKKVRNEYKKEAKRMKRRRKGRANKSKTKKNNQENYLEGRIIEK